MQETQETQEHLFEDSAIRANRAMEPNESGNSRRFSTNQWVRYDEYEAFKRCARACPHFAVEVGRIKEADGLVFICLTFIAAGKILFVRQLVNFIIVSMRDYHIRSV